ncbi:MAG: ribbon-helix-helix domain-containing protein [Coriobacteriales bacterium]|jgi:hypothetical protein|nr:ribbon-helix-helix domain-containing protein [Coriobacteriales bacterium]
MYNKNNPFVTSHGAKISDDLFDELADGFESGEWPGHTTVVLGRPKLANENIRPITFRLPESKILELDARAKMMGKSRSEAVRLALDQFLATA